MSFSFSKATKGLVAGGVAVLIAANGFAATQGNVGATSTGTLNISLDIADEVRISALEDIVLGQFAGADMSGSSPACVYRSGTGLYNILITGGGTGSAFELTDGTQTLDYTVTFDGTSITNNSTALSRTGADPASDSCATSTLSTVAVNVLASDMTGLSAGSFTDTLTLVVAAE